MAEIFEKLSLCKESLTLLNQARTERNDWANRLKLVEIKLENNPSSEALQFLRGQAILNHDLAQEIYADREQHYAKLSEIAEGAEEALGSLERIALAEATREARQNRSAHKISRSSGNEAVEGMSETSIRELNQAENYVKALTELNMEEVK